MVASLVEAPAVGAPLGVGAAVRAVRGRVGAAGTVPGAVGAAVTFAIVPRLSDEAARGVAVSQPSDVEPSIEGDGLVVVANVHSGSGEDDEVVEAVAAALPAAEIVSCEGEGLDEALGDAVSRCRALGIIGGDGSVNLAARAALDAGVPLTIFPGGTLNHFARALGVDTVDEAVAAVREGQVVAIDVATIADRAYLNNASIGDYAALVDERERLEHRFGKWPAMVLALTQVLRRSERLEVTVDGRSHRVWMIFFGNGAFEPAGFAPTDRPDLVDGLLDTRVLHATTRWSRCRVIAATLFGRLDRSPVYERWLSPRVTVRCGGQDTARLAVDGETFDGPGSFTVTKRPAALLVHARHPDPR